MSTIYKYQKTKQGYIKQQLCYWCEGCRDDDHPRGKRVFEYCGHRQFGNICYIRNLSPLKDGYFYWCWDCAEGEVGKLVNKDCGHEDFGKKDNLRNPIPGRMYYCGYCGDYLTEDDGDGCFGNKFYLVEHIPLEPGQCRWCEECVDEQHPYGKQVFEDCGHLCFDNPYAQRNIILKPNQCYWCSDCNDGDGKQVFDNCGHEDFGKKDNLRDLTQGKLYWCSDCSDLVSENCGHENFGEKWHLVKTFPLGPNQCCWCQCCNDGDGKQVFTECGHDVIMSEEFRDLTPRKCYWCSDCRKIINYNCGHENYGDKYYLVDMTGQRQYMKQIFKKYNFQLVCISKSKQILNQSLK